MRPRHSLALLVVAAVLTSGAPPSLAVDGHGGGNRWLFPGEYESHQAMWMFWPTFEYKAGFPSTDPMSEMIQALRGHTHVNLGVQDAADEADARSLLSSNGVPLDHVHFFHIPHGDIWARDMGPQFTRRAGRLRINDWNFNMWGHEEPDSEPSRLEEPVDRMVAEMIQVPVLDAREGPTTGVRMIHEGGSVTHNGHGTMVAVESVVIQRNLGPERFCGGQAPVTDFSQPNTYAPNPDWPPCRALVEEEYRRMLGVRKVIWVPTGVIEDQGTFRGPLGTHIHVPRFEGIDIPHAGVYTAFTTNGHPDELLRFVAPNQVLLAQERVPTTPVRTPVEQLMRWLQERNHERLERAYRILERETTESGEPIQIIRIPTPQLVFDVFLPGDGQYDYYAAYDRWEDGSTVPEAMLFVWPSSYVNYVPTNDLVLVSRFWKPGRSLEHLRRDREAVEILRDVFPGRKVVPIYTENVNRGGGGMNCITQQQPASARFAEACGWSKVTVAAQVATLYASPIGGSARGSVPRLTSRGRDVYLERLSSFGLRVRVRVSPGGQVGWIDQGDLESAGEKCPDVYTLN